MGQIFIGGPGRSGTSFVADRIGRIPDVTSFEDVELKIFFEKDGLYDLYDVLVSSYSPNRAIVSLQAFKRVFMRLVNGGYGQPNLNLFAPAEYWQVIIKEFEDALCKNGHPMPHTKDAFLKTLREFIYNLQKLSFDRKEGASIFLEKTPHNLLNAEFLTALFPEAKLLHVMRDPRAIAYSLLSMSWGPNTIEGSAAWVESYCRQWEQKKKTYVDKGISLYEAYIEDISLAPEYFSEKICEFLGVARTGSIFKGANIETINSWVQKSTLEQKEYLNKALGDCVVGSGYESSQYGKRIQVT